MKNKKKFILILFSILIIIAISAAILLIISKGDNHSTDTDYENEQDYTNEETSEQNEFWLDNHKNWGNQKEIGSLTLFEGKFQTPIDLKNVNEFAKEIRYYPNGYNGKTTNDINEVLSSEIMIDSDTPIWLAFGEKNEYGNYSELIEITSNCFNETETSIKECLANNWWSISDIHSVPDALMEYFGITIDSLNSDYHPNWDTRPLLDEIIKILGGPKHIYKSLNWDEEDNSRYYSLHYEYSDFTLAIDVVEIYAGNNYMCKINSFTYAPNEYWEAFIQNHSDSFFKY